jgi:hypothetical protein
VNRDRKLLEEDIHRHLHRLLSFSGLSAAPGIIHERISALPLEAAAEFLPEVEGILMGEKPLEIFTDQPGGPLAIYASYRQHVNEEPGEPPVATEPFLSAFRANGKPIEVRYDAERMMFIRSPQQSIPLEPSKYILRRLHIWSHGRWLSFACEKDPLDYSIAVVSFAEKNGRKLLYSQFKVPIGRS